MWSHLYFYYQIRGNAKYTESLPTETVISTLESTAIFKKRDRQQFSNHDQYPWIDLVAVKSENGNFGRPEHFNSETVNLIAIVGSKSEPENESFYANLFTGIAEQLNWEFILEEDDDGNEDVVIRPISPLNQL